VLACLGLNFELELPRWVTFDCEAKREVNTRLCLFSLAGSEPRRYITDSINDWCVGFGPMSPEVVSCE
jgi:hypothetical protein